MPVKDIFHCVGVSYKKADAKLRGKFNLSSKTALKLLNEAKASGIKSIVVNSTCNRTEIYSEIENPSSLIDLFCKHTEGSFEEFESSSEFDGQPAALVRVFRYFKWAVLNDVDQVCFGACTPAGGWRMR